jgi:hypothetical protein
MTTMKERKERKALSGCNETLESYRDLFYRKCKAVPRERRAELGAGALPAAHG